VEMTSANLLSDQEAEMHDKTGTPRDMKCITWKRICRLGPSLRQTALNGNSHVWVKVISRGRGIQWEEREKEKRGKVGEHTVHCPLATSEPFSWTNEVPLDTVLASVGEGHQRRL